MAAVMTMPRPELGTRRRPPRRRGSRPAPSPGAGARPVGRHLLAPASRRRRGWDWPCWSWRGRRAPRSGAHPSRPPSAARPSRGTSSSPATRCGRSPNGSRPGATPARSSTSSAAARGDAPLVPGEVIRLDGADTGRRTVAGPGIGGRYRGAVRCPYCQASDDKVVDSRPADEGAAIRRRRECLACGRRFTTYERSRSSAHRREALGRQGAVRPGEARGRDRPGGRPVAPSPRARWPRSATEIEEAAAGRGRRGGERARSASRCSSGCRPSTRSRTCGSRRSTRASRTSPTSSARSRAPEDDGAQGRPAPAR